MASLFNVVGLNNGLFIQTHRNTMIKISLAVYILAIMFLAPSYSEATGVQLLEQCRETQTYLRTDKMRFPAYVGRCLGVLEGVRHSMILIDGNNYKTCFPKNGIINSEAVDIIVDYLNSHRHLLHQNETHLILLAYQNAFPCR